MDALAAGRLHFGPHSIDLDQCVLVRDTRPVHLRPKTFDVLRHLAMRAGQLVTKQELIEAVWPDAAVSDDSLVQCVKELRLALHDTSQTVIKTVPRRGYLFSPEINRTMSTNGPKGPLPQAIKFCRSTDGTTIAVSDAGVGAPLMLAPSWFGHLECDWRNPVSAPLLHVLANKYRLVRFDIRGTGLSDRNVPAFSLNAFEQDCEAAAMAMGLDRYAVFGLSTPGAAIAVAHAAAHPDRVSKLILHGGFAQGRKRRNCEKDAEISDALLALLRHGWGDRHSPFVRMFVSRYLPNGSAEQFEAIGELQHMAASCDVAAKLWTLWNEIDLVDLLPRIQAPTLVLHSRSNDVSPLSEGRRIAAAIPNASLIVLETANHVPVPGEPAWTEFRQAIEGFLA
jgi:DNA-binding winged helix-turn-helix (wHTH) protein/alpha-beta hydrolase superfamily lysophospholipase